MSYEEYKARAVHDICENLKVYFETIRQLKAHCRELEEQSKTTDRVADSAIDRIEIEWQMKEMQGQVSHAMIYGTPESLGLGDLYKKFLSMYDLILEEQEAARMIAAKKERDRKWQRELRRNHRIDRAIVTAAVMVLILWMWGFLLSLGWLVKTHNGLSSELSSSHSSSSLRCLFPLSSTLTTCASAQKFDRRFVTSRNLNSN